MVQIKIKGVNQAYHVVASFDDADAFFIQLKERLKACQRNPDRFFEAFFHIDELQGDLMLRLFAVCAECQTLILGINELPHAVKTIVVEEELRGGEQYVFEDSVVLLGSIRKQAYVTCHHDLYVLGEVHGSVDLLHEENVLCCSQLEGNVRICDSHFQNMTSLAPCKVYYESRRLEMKEYKEERMWERQ